MRSGFINAAAAVRIKAGWYQRVASLFRAVKVLLIIFFWPLCCFFCSFAVSLQNKSSKPFVPTQTAVVCSSIFSALFMTTCCWDDSREFGAPLGAFKVVLSPWPSLRLHPPDSHRYMKVAGNRKRGSYLILYGIWLFSGVYSKPPSSLGCLGRSREDADEVTQEIWGYKTRL